MEKKNILPELQKQLLFVIEYKLVRDSEKTIANKEKKYYLYRLDWWVLSSEIWSVKFKQIKFEMVKVPWETFSKG